MASMGFAMTAVGIFAVVAAVSYLLHRLFKNHRVVKYFPSLLLLAAAVYFFGMATRSHGSFEDLAMVVMAMLAFSGFLSGLVFSLVLDFVVPRFRRK